jgi:hypothetical protein
VTLRNFEANRVSPWGYCFVIGAGGPRYEIDENLIRNSNILIFVRTWLCPSLNYMRCSCALPSRRYKTYCGLYELIQMYFVCF